jgi:hypothetical protein
MAWIDTDYVDNAIGSTVRSAIAPTAGVFNQWEAAARARVKEAASVAGYSLPDTTSSDQLKDLCLGVWIVLTYAGRKGLRVPEQYRDVFYRLDLIANGKARLVDYTPSSRDGIGGSSFSATSGTNARPQQFSRSKLSNW